MKLWKNIYNKHGIFGKPQTISIVKKNNCEAGVLSGMAPVCSPWKLVYGKGDVDLFKKEHSRKIFALDTMHLGVNSKSYIQVVPELEGEIYDIKELQKRYPEKIFVEADINTEVTEQAPAQRFGK